MKVKLDICQKCHHFIKDTCEIDDYPFVNAMKEDGSFTGPRDADFIMPYDCPFKLEHIVFDA